MARKRTTARKAPLQLHDPRSLQPIIVLTPPGQEKRSEVLLRFAEPLLQDLNDDVEKFRFAIQLSVLVWNLATFPPAERKAATDVTIKTAPLWFRPLVKQYLATMMARKETLFAEYRWYIYDYQVLEEADELHVVVMAEAA